jgi:hypothetical protein
MSDISRHKNSQMAPYFEAEMRRNGHQMPEAGYSGIGYWYSGYPSYLGATNAYSSPGAAYPPDAGAQAQPDADSPITGAASETGATSSGDSSGASGAGLL